MADNCANYLIQSRTVTATAKNASRFCVVIAISAKTLHLTNQKSRLAGLMTPAHTAKES